MSLPSFSDMVVMSSVVPMSATSLACSSVVVCRFSFGFYTLVTLGALF